MFIAWPTAASEGAAFADAIASKDYAPIAELLHPEVDFRALTLVEQRAFLRERDGRIGWVRLVCSGSRPV